MKQNYPRLYSQTSTGKLKWWEIEVSGKKSGNATITVRYAGDGEVERESTKEIAEGKNIGKKNETSPWEQACSEAQSTWKKKIDKGYKEDQAMSHASVLLPMLALQFEKRKHDIAYPAAVQAKLDGVRVLVEKKSKTKVVYYSRQGKEYGTLHHLDNDLLRLMRVGEVWDGEIYSHDITFQEMMSYVKKQRPESEKLAIWFFDLVNPNLTFHERYYELETALTENNNSLIKLVHTYDISSEEDVYKYHDRFIEDGFEGVIIRNWDGFYKLKDRSKDLQKLKAFIDEEYEIIGGEPGTGTETGCIVFTCKNKKGQEFKVRPRGSFELRKEWMMNIYDIIGKQLTVRYQELTDDGVPRFPVGIGIRDYE
jgi:DNA ligase-1